MKEKTVLLATVLILMLGFFSAGMGYTGEFHKQWVGDQGKKNLCGDVNRDGTLTHKDFDALRAVIMAAARGDYNTRYSSYQTDVNGDGELNQADMDALNECFERIRAVSPVVIRGNDCVAGGTTCHEGNVIGCGSDPVTGRWEWDYKNIVKKCIDGVERCIGGKCVQTFISRYPGSKYLK